MDEVPSTGKIIRAYAAMITVGVVLGLASRFVLVGERSNTQILPSFLGLVAMFFIGGGIWGMLKCWRQPWPNAGILFGLSLTLAIGGIMWVVPLPH